jgi:hypothetical protein
LWTEGEQNFKKRKIKLSNQKPLPPIKTDGRITSLMGGLIVFILLLAVGSGYILGSGKRSRSTAIAVTRTDSPVHGPVETEATESPQEIPEGVPENDAPGTPVPGFTDNFDDGLDPVWSVIYGQPVVANGQLTSNIDTGIAAGDASWENYQIDFDVDTAQIDCPFVDSSNSVGVRVTDFDHAYWFVFTGCQAAWSPFAGGVSEGVPNVFPDTTVNASKGKKHITINVDETKMSAYENGTLRSAIIDSKLQTGGMFLQVEAQTFYDNFKVTLLP